MISKTKRSIASAGVMLNNMTTSIANDNWGLNKLNLFLDKNKSSDLYKFIDEINYENSEYMSYRKEFHELNELKPSYLQLNQLQINEQSNMNLLILKSLENIIEEHILAYQKYSETIQKSKNSYDIFHETNGTLRYALDTLFVYIEQELQQARQHIQLNDLKKLISDAKIDTHRKSTNYLVTILTPPPLPFLYLNDIYITHTISHYHPVSLYSKRLLMLI